MSEETYHRLRREREVSFHLDDLDAALASMAKVADLYPRLDKKQQGILLQILAKQIIVDPHGKIVEHVFRLPFMYLRSLAQNLSPRRRGWWFGTCPLRGIFHKSNIPLLFPSSVQE